MKVRIIGCVAISTSLVTAPAFAWGAGSPNPAAEAPAPAPPPAVVEPTAEPAAPAPPPPPAAETATAPPEAAPPRPPDAIPISVELEEETTPPAPAPPAPARPLPPSLRPAPTSAEAPPDDLSDESHQRERAQRWYGWQLLIADGASIVLVAAGADAGLQGWGVLSYFFTPPIIHWAHGHTAKGFGSLALRFGLPIVGASIGSVVSGCARKSTGCPQEAIAVGALVGFAGAIAIDSAVLAYEDEKPRRSSAHQLTPTFDVGKHAARVGLAGTF